MADVGLSWFVLMQEKHFIWALCLQLGQVADPFYKL